MQPCIQARDAHHVSIAGEGTIDGRGQRWWEYRNRIRSEKQGGPYTPIERELRALAELKTVVDREDRLHLVDTCSVAGLGGKPYRDGSFSYYVSSAVATDDFKGVGPFILALAELYRLDALI
mgnify:CR=1 FL=1